MGKALRSDNPTNAEINRYYHISVSRWIGTKEAQIKGKLVEIDRYSASKLTSANRLSDFIGEETKIRQFKQVLEFKKPKYPFLIRKRLKIVFYPK
jgi:hypothetical protein